ncbi:MAG: hypothetical protein Q4G68_02240 [Planctomycetia bacterium]|nr:hypothetical protein [Planctomycetia bacterium]
MQNKLWALILGVSAVIVAAGCSNNNRGGLSGAVTLGGQPLNNASIQFVSENGVGSPGGAAVVNGRYEVPNEPGLEAGTYIVNIHAFDVPDYNGKSLLSADASLPEQTNSKDRIPASWNDAKNSITIKPGKNVFDFDVPAE